MGDHPPPPCDYSQGRNAGTNWQHYLSTCPVCGTPKTFNLCPVCDRHIITSRQKRLEAGLRQTQQSKMADFKKLEMEIRARDLTARKELSKKAAERHYLLQSLIFGCALAIPMLVIGLQMSIQNIIRPLGVILLLAGIGLLGFAVHRRIIYDSIQNARKWQNLSRDEKLNYVARLRNQAAVKPPPLSNRDNFKKSC